MMICHFLLFIIMAPQPPPPPATAAAVQSLFSDDVFQAVNVSVVWVMLRISTSANSAHFARHTILVIYFFCLFACLCRNLDYKTNYWQAKFKFSKVCKQKANPPKSSHRHYSTIIRTLNDAHWQWQRWQCCYGRHHPLHRTVGTLPERSSTSKRAAMFSFTCLPVFSVCKECLCVCFCVFN